MFKKVSTFKHPIIVIAFSSIALFGMLACGGTTSGSNATPTVAPTNTVAVSASSTPSSTVAPTAPFKVTRIDMAVNPTTIAGLACGTALKVVYTATFHVAANGPGGKVLFGYTVNNGRGDTMASLTFGPGVTTRTYTFIWSGNLPADHTYPEPGGVMTSSPNQVTSRLVGPKGMCS